jgi:hypothetical protein
MDTVALDYRGGLHSACFHVVAALKRDPVFGAFSGMSRLRGKQHGLPAGVAAVSNAIRKPPEDVFHPPDHWLEPASLDEIWIVQTGPAADALVRRIAELVSASKTASKVVAKCVFRHIILLNWNCFV